LVQRRVKHAERTVESFQRTMELGVAFDGTKVALERYQRSLSLFEDPRYLESDYKRSNGTVETFMNLVDEVVPELTVLLSQWES